MPKLLGKLKKICKKKGKIINVQLYFLMDLAGHYIDKRQKTTETQINKDTYSKKRRRNKQNRWTLAGHRKNIKNSKK